MLSTTRTTDVWTDALANLRRDASTTPRPC